MSSALKILRHLVKIGRVWALPDRTCPLGHWVIAASYEAELLIRFSPLQVCGAQALPPNNLANLLRSFNSEKSGLLLAVRLPIQTLKYLCQI